MRLKFPGIYFNYFNTCTVHILLFCTVTNKCIIISQIITFLHVSTLSCHPQGACKSIPCQVTQIFQMQLLVILPSIPIAAVGNITKYFKCSCW
jgi:hypothetical protein